MANPIKRRLLFIVALAVWTLATFGVGYLVGVSMPEHAIAKGALSPDNRFAAYVKPELFTRSIFGVVGGSGFDWLSVVAEMSA